MTSLQQLGAQRKGDEKLEEDDNHRSTRIVPPVDSIAHADLSSHPKECVVGAAQGPSENMLSPVERAAAFREMKLAREQSRGRGPPTTSNGNGKKSITPGSSGRPSSSFLRNEQVRGTPLKPTAGLDRFGESAQASAASVVSSVVENCTLFFFHSNEYLLFLAPPRVFATVAAWTAASRATFEILFVTPNEKATTAKVLSVFWIVLLAISIALVLVDGAFYLLRRKKLISRLTEARAIRLLLLLTFWLVVVRNALSTIDYWICSGRLSLAARDECLYHLDSRNHYALLFPFLATFPFWHNFLCLLILVLTEFVAGSVYMGQPAEVRVARYIFVFALCAAFLALYWWREVEARRRYSLVRRLAAIEAGKKLKMESLVRTLLSLAAPDQVQALLQGRPLRIESPRCTILVTDIDQYLNFRQQMDPYTAVRLLEDLVEDMETLRKSLRLQKLYFRGDVYITAIGLRERGLHDHTPILMFASKYPAKALRVSRMYIHPIRARFGFGTGAGACVIYGGKTLAKGFCGEAFDDAKRHAKVVAANVIEVSDRTLEACPSLSATRTPSTKNAGFTVLSRIREISSMVPSNTTPVVTTPTAVSSNFPTVPSRRIFELAGASSKDPSPTLGEAQAIVIPPLLSSSSGAEVVELKSGSPSGDTRTGDPPTQPSRFSLASPTSIATDDANNSSDPNLLRPVASRDQLEIQEPPRSASAIRPTSPQPPPLQPQPTSASAEQQVPILPADVEEMRLPMGRGKDAFSSDSSDCESDSNSYTGDGTTDGAGGLSESAVVHHPSDTNLLAESAMFFPAADRQTAATRRAIEKQTTLFAVLFKEFRYRSVAEESKWKNWMVSFGEQSGEKSSSPNVFQKSVSTRGSSGDHGPGSNTVPTRSSFSTTALISAVGASSSLPAGTSSMVPPSSNDASAHRIEFDASEVNAMEDPLLRQCAQRHCSEAEEVERAFHDGLSAKRFPFFRAAVMITLLIGNVGALAASSAYTVAAAALHLLAFVAICVGYLLGNRFLESDEISSDSPPAPPNQPPPPSETPTPQPRSPTTKEVDRIEDKQNPLEPRTSPPAIHHDTDTLPPVSAVDEGSGQELAAASNEPPVTVNGNANSSSSSCRGWRCTRLQHAYLQSGCDILVVALIVIATLVSGPSLLRSSLDHSFTYLYIIAVLTGGLPMQTALTALFFLWAPLAISSVNDAFSLSVGYGIRELVWILVIFTFVGLIALNEGVSIRRSVQYLLAQRANTQLAIAFEKRHQEVLGKMMPQHFVAAVEKRIIAAGRGTAAETIHDVAVLRFSLRPINVMDLGHVHVASASVNSLSAQGFMRSLSHGQGRQMGLGGSTRSESSIHPTPGMGSSIVVSSTEPSTGGPRTVLDELERRIILIEQALVGLETAWFTFWDGDTGEVSGPLHKSQPNFLAMPAVSKALGRQWHEEQGNKATVELVRFLMRLRTADLWPWKGLLHRRDGLAVVFGLERPTFVLTGAVTEVASEAFSEVVSEGEVVMTEAFLKQFPTELAWTTFGRRGAPLKPHVVQGLASVSFDADLSGAPSSGSNSTREPMKRLQVMEQIPEPLVDAVDSSFLLPHAQAIVPTPSDLTHGPDRRKVAAATNDSSDEAAFLLSQEFWDTLGLQLGPLRTARMANKGFLRVRTLKRIESRECLAGEERSL